MKRRITIAIVVVALGAVLLAGIGTSLLSWRQARHEAMAQLSDEAAALVPFVTGSGVGDGPRAASNSKLAIQRITLARRALRLVDASVVVVRGNGSVDVNLVPAGVDPGAVTAAAVSGSATHGMNRDLAWAIAVSDVGEHGRRIAVVLTRKVPLGAGAFPWVVLSAVVAAVAAMFAARLLAKRIADPLKRVEVATRRIAQGDLSTRLGEPGKGIDDEIIGLARSVDAMASSLEASRTAERNFLLSVSHDLRTPITSMRGYAEAIVDGVAPDSVAAARVILSESARLERLVSDLLDLTKLDAHHFSFHPSTIDVVDLVRRSVQGFVPLATGAAVGLNLHVGDAASGPIPVDVDADRLAQVVANLIENAISFAATVVDVTVDRAGPHARVAVNDDGPGIDPGDRPHVFERFHTGRGAGDGRRRGSGLGLAISYEFVLAMGGTLAASPNPAGNGTMMTILLPLSGTVTSTS